MRFKNQSQTEGNYSRIFSNKRILPVKLLNHCNQGFWKQNCKVNLQRIIFFAIAEEQKKIVQFFQDGYKEIISHLDCCVSISQCFSKQGKCEATWSTKMKRDFLQESFDRCWENIFLINLETFLNAKREEQRERERKEKHSSWSVPNTTRYRQARSLTTLLDKIKKNFMWI